MSRKAAVVMGSDSDLKVMTPALETLESFGIPFEVRVLSAHRTPRKAAEFAEKAVESGFGVIICAAGKAAHLGGVLAAHTILPVVAVPIDAGLSGLDALLSTAQMPPGVPVASMAVNGAKNAAVFAAEILALADPSLSDRLSAFKEDMEKAVLEKDEKVRKTYSRGTDG